MRRDAYENLVCSEHNSWRRNDEVRREAYVLFSTHPLPFFFVMRRALMFLT